MIYNDLPSDWKTLLQSEFEKPYFIKLMQSYEDACKHAIVYPQKEYVFNAFRLCSVENVKVVLIGQDPYHGEMQANGLSFSVNTGIKKPPSLQNIFKEMKNDLMGFEIPESGNLEKWAKEGVLLLNAILSVEHSKPGSHKRFGWEKLTNALIKNLSDKKNNLVFLLWGNYAISKKELIDPDKHLILCAAHPSPLARGAFFGNKHFSKTNKYLTENRIMAVNWDLS